jgi:hypothetical protein
MIHLALHFTAFREDCHGARGCRGLLNVVRQSVLPPTPLGLRVAELCGAMWWGASLASVPVLLVHPLLMLSSRAGALLGLASEPHGTVGDPTIYSTGVSSSTSSSGDAEHLIGIG